jgi:hypothetical protein
VNRRQSAAIVDLQIAEIIDLECKSFKVHAKMYSAWIEPD